MSVTVVPAPHGRPCLAGVWLKFGDIAMENSPSWFSLPRRCSVENLLLGIFLLSKSNCKSLCPSGPVSGWKVSASVGDSAEERWGRFARLL